MLAELIRGAVDGAVTSQMARRAQEPPISTRVVSALEKRLDRVAINDYRVTVVARDSPIADASRGSTRAAPTVPPEYLQGGNVAERFRDILDCFSGDAGLVAPDIFENDFTLAAFLEQIAVKRGVTIKLAPAKRRT